MPIDRDSLPEVVSNAWREALCDMPTVNRGRSTSWVSALGNQFKAGYQERDGYRVFWRSNACNQKDFGLNEFLFDIAVCSISETRSLQRTPKALPFVSDCHWLVESEFAVSTRDSILRTRFGLANPDRAVPHPGIHACYRSPLRHRVAFE